MARRSIFSQLFRQSAGYVLFFIFKICSHICSDFGHAEIRSGANGFAAWNFFALILK